MHPEGSPFSIPPPASRDLSAEERSRSIRSIPVHLFTFRLWVRPSRVRHRPVRHLRRRVFGCFRIERMRRIFTRGLPNAVTQRAGAVV